MPSIEIASSGHNEFVAVAGNKTLAATDQGVVQDVRATATLTLPAAAAGANQVIRVGKEGITLNITPNGTDTIQGAGLATGGAGKGLIFANQPGGSFVQLIGQSGGWTVARILGTVTRQP